MKPNICFYKVIFMFSIGAAVVAAPPDMGAEKLFETGTGFGLRVSMELKRGGAVRAVSPQTIFQSGDNVKLHLTSNFDGYIYVLDEGTSGNTTLLYPASQTGTSNLVKTGHEYVIPETAGSFRVTGQAGVERLIVIASPRALGQLEQQYAKPAPSAPTTTTPPATPPSAPKPSTTSAAPVPGTATPVPPANRAGAPSANNQPGTMTQTRQDVQQVNQGISTGRQITSIPNGVVSIFKNVVPRDLVLEDDPQEGAAYVSGNTKTLTDPVIFTVSIVHN